MAFASNISLLTLKTQGMLAALGESVKGMLGYGHYNDFSPEEVLLKTPNIDPRFIAKAPMSNANLDVHTLSQLGSIGLKRGKEITAQSHPELYAAFAQMSARAGLNHPPQLILAESKTVNALTISPQEVCVTTGLLKLLNLREVNAVLGHELGHGSSDHTTPRVIALAAFGVPGAYVGDVISSRLLTPSIVEKEATNVWQHMRNYIACGPSALLRAAIQFTSIAGGIYAGKVAAHYAAYRPTEFEADRKGAMISGDPEGLISALTKLGRTHQANPLLRLFQDLTASHPPIPSRINHLRTLEKNIDVSLKNVNPETLKDGFSSMPAAEMESVPVLGQSPTALITGAALAERVGTPVAPAHAQG